MLTRFLLVALVFCCGYRPPVSVIDRPDLGRFFDAEKLNGSFLLYDLKKDRYIAYRYARSQKGFLPASTYKIINTLIGLETGLLADEATIMKWDGVRRAREVLNKDMTLREAFQVSCVPCYQELARKIGLERMRSFVQEADYGHMDIQAGNLDTFWLRGKSRISPKEEVDFLRRVYTGQVPFSKPNLATLKKVMLLDDQPTHRLYGKTGWASEIDGIGIDGPDIGWFVGYVEKGDDVYFFATNIESSPPVPDTFLAGRRRVTERILTELGIL
ncbi:beta-lactamase class D [Spirosoma lacussanchae]|uniref:class D beta-lactamase n=1 Tax=Spirosoma lacussanchae TaxID=1884249 RepID=UPI00110854F7|nr:class D beta-lactamase [Spirosoma lacussanchae]